MAAPERTITPQSAPNSERPPLLYTFYGDDFTGSTDVLEQLSANGIHSALFLASPTSAQLRRFPGLRAFGIAGDSRSRSPAWMTEHLPNIFRALRSFNTPLTHYKVCSTFDSSPATGSIGRAIEVGLDIFSPPFVPIVVGAPHLRRFVLDGNLFASAPGGQIHRIDRHPMNRHPVTPMREPDLRRHLAAQTALPTGLITHDDLRSSTAVAAALDTLLAQGRRIILFDTADPLSLGCIGDFLWRHAQRQPLFSASSSGLTSALIAAWRAAGLLAVSQSPSEISDAPAPVNSAQPDAPLLVLSGSCSPMTALAIQWSLAHDFHGIAVDPNQLASSATAATARQTLLDRTLASLAAGRDTVLYTALGQPTSDPASPATGHALGAALGLLLREILAHRAVPRVVLCGGDTSSHAVQQLGLLALTWLASLEPGTPLCRAHFPDPNAPPLGLVLKGGQVGSADFFAVAKAAPTHTIPTMLFA